MHEQWSARNLENIRSGDTMKKIIQAFCVILFSCAISRADRWIVYSSTPAINCSGFLNGGKLTTNGSDTFCSDDASGGGGGGSTPGGSNTNVQSNHPGGTFYGDSGFQYDSSVSSVTIGGTVGATTGLFTNQDGSNFAAIISGPYGTSLSNRALNISNTSGASVGNTSTIYFSAIGTLFGSPVNMALSQIASIADTSSASSNFADLSLQTKSNGSMTEGIRIIGNSSSSTPTVQMASTTINGTLTLSPLSNTLLAVNSSGIIVSTTVTASGSSGSSIYPASSTTSSPFGASFSTITVTQTQTGVVNAMVITSTGTGIPLQIIPQGFVSNGLQNQKGVLTIGDNINTRPFSSYVVLVDSTTDAQNGGGMMEFWSNSPNHNDPKLWFHVQGKDSSPEIRDDANAPNWEMVNTSTDNTHGLGKFEPAAVAYQGIDLQRNSRSKDNGTFQNVELMHALQNGGGIELAAPLNNDGNTFGIDTAPLQFDTTNSHVVGLTGPMAPTAGWTFALPRTPNNLGQVLYQSDNGRGGPQNARSWDFTTCINEGYVFTYHIGGPPTCTAPSSGGASTLAVGTGTASNFTNNVTSPTAAISFEGAQFKSAALGTTNYISLNQSSVTLRGANISNGVAGAVQFSDGSGGFNSDDTNFHWDNSGKRLGIGTVSPEYPLQINGASSVAEMNWTDATSLGSLVFKQSGSFYGSFQFIGGSFSDSTRQQNFEFINATSGGGMTFWTNTTVREKIDSNGLIGIGTELPGAQLHIVDNSASRIGQIIQGASSQSVDLIETQDSGSNVKWGVDKNGYPFPPSRTKAQLSTDVPSKAGLEAYCSDCSTDGIVVSTGTAAGAWGRISARTTVIN